MRVTPARLCGGSQAPGLGAAAQLPENTALAALPLIPAPLGAPHAERELVAAMPPPARETPSLETSLPVSAAQPQKLALAKWLARDCDVLIVTNHPASTRPRPRFTSARRTPARRRCS